MATPSTAASARRDTAALGASERTGTDSTHSDSARSAAAAIHHDARLSVHGYLTRDTRGCTWRPVYGIRDRRSAAFRYTTLQGRYTLTSADNPTVQLSHRQLGDSPISDLDPAVKLNWAFYEHRFTDGTSIQAGRIPIPRGIYNALRSVGVALPMFRPPVVFYDEGAYYSETIDGVVASRTFFADAPWSLETHAYAGQWKSLLYDTWDSVYAVQRIHARHAVGGQLWLNTPLEGVRFGAAAQRYRYDDNALLGAMRMKEYHVSFDATRESGFLRAETELQDYGTDKFYSGYAQLGARLVGQLHGVIELQRSYDTDVKYGDGKLPSSYAWHRSNGAGLSYAFAPTLVAKLEQHWDRGIQLEQPGDPLNPPRFRYTIASLSVSF